MQLVLKQHGAKVTGDARSASSSILALADHVRREAVKFVDELKRV
jgi:hypothetical protein